MLGLPNVVEGFELLDLETAKQLGFASDDSPSQNRLHEQIHTVERFYQFAERDRRNRLAGFKFAPYQLTGQGELASYLRNIDAHVILLTRTDILAAAVSSIGALALHNRNAGVNVVDPTQSVGKIRIGKDELFYNITEQILERTRVLAFRDVFNASRILEVNYEKMCRNISRQMKRILDFLWYSAPDGAKFHGLTHKNMLPSVSHSIENYEEVVSWLRGTLFEWTLGKETK